VFTFLVNKSISLGKFPEKLKEAQVVPYKKSNALDKSNYRPVSILPVISKFFERAINVYIYANLYFIHVIRERTQCENITFVSCRSILNLRK
jgi:hypothetical protein